MRQRPGLATLRFNQSTVAPIPGLKPTSSFFRKEVNDAYRNPR